MKKHNQKQDSSAIDPEQAALEARIDAMLDPSRPNPPTTGSIKVRVDDTADIDQPEETDNSTAPVLPDMPVPKEPIKISIREHIEEDEPPITEQADAAVESTEAPGDTTEDSQELPDEGVEVEPEVTTEDSATDDEAAEEQNPLAFEDLPTPDEPDIEEVAPVESKFDDELLSRAVDDIVAEESDKLLAAEDAAAVAPTRSAEKSHRIRRFFSGWRHNPFARWITIGFVAAVVAAAALIPVSRYYILNALGVRSKASVVVIDQSTQQPLKNVQVTLGDVVAQTNESGEAFFEGLQLGPSVLALEKRAFAPIYHNVTIGWGSNPLGTYRMEPVGSQYVFTVKDYLSGKPVVSASATSEYADANADEEGRITLTLDEAENVDIEVSISAPGYRTEKMTLDLAARQQNDVVLVSDQRHAFISRRAGTYDLYAIDVDGKNEKLVLPGTGSERPDMVVVPHPDNTVVALVSTRDNQRNKDGYLMSTLNIVNLNTSNVVKVTTSEQIQIVGWSGDRLAYVQIAAGASAANPNRQRLMSFDYKQHDNRQLASANYFNDVMTIGELIYYAGSSGSAYDAGGHFMSIKFDGSGQKTILPTQTWNAFRTDYNKLVLSTPDKWYDYTIDQAAVTELPGQPADSTSRFYTDSQDGNYSLWIDTRDGKGTLMVRDVEKQEEKPMLSGGGLGSPARWIDTKIIVYRVTTDKETADYVMSIEGGEPKKIVDVNATGGNDRWYYY